MKVDHPLGKMKYWRRLLHPSEFAAFALKYNRHSLRLPRVRPALERHFMNHVKNRYRHFDPRQQLWETIAIQTIDDCNGTCRFCPNSVLKRTKTALHADTFGQILAELAQLEYRNAMVLDLQCDPFLDSRIEEFTARASAACPQASIFLSTNGYALTEPRYHEILRSPNVDLVVNDYTADQRVLGKIRSWHIASEERCRSRFVCKPQPNSITNLGFMPTRFRLPLRQACNVPFRELSIIATGECVLCCSDWQKEHVVGNVGASSLKEIWCGEPLQEVRAKLMDNRREGLCAKCDDIGYRPKMRTAETSTAAARVQPSYRLEIPEPRAAESPQEKTDERVPSR